MQIYVPTPSHSLSPIFAKPKRRHFAMHTGEKILAKDLASLVGYTEYYLTCKFKEETGLSMSEYIKNVKMERAKILLKSTQMSVQEISEALAFGTRNYFNRIFAQTVGCTPVEFRKKQMF